MEDLSRFVEAQDTDGAYDRALAELRAGRKRTHWMWFVFPQLLGLGSSPMAQRYGIASLDEAREYLAHPVLGPRLLEASGVVVGLDEDPDALLGQVDAMKLRSSMTLFEVADPAEPVFATVLGRRYFGERDERTLALLS